MKASTNRPLSPPAALILKLIGLICIVSFLVDAFTLLIPFNPTDRGWQINLTTQLVERGIIPLVGMAFLFAGTWIDSVADTGKTAPIWEILKLVALVLSGILGLVYLVIAPLHVNNVRIQSNTAIQRVAEQAKQAETQLSSDAFKNQVEQRRTLIKNQIGELIKDDQKYNQALQNQQIPKEVKDVLQQSKANPQVLDDFLNQQAKSFSNQTLTQIRERQQQLENQAKTAELKSQLQIGLSSVLLALGFFMTAGTGLRGIVSLPSAPRKSKTPPKR
ncbi:HpsJ family protein [Floridanema evergladense]|uniref:HpsJ family protein n=1 Tax=Floridaenema evergladense BLCC-F167 TaxID=3153639 RepID=A0ABV4WML2_9CYAN